jgi:sulfatase modifying factor 1
MRSLHALALVVTCACGVFPSLDGLTDSDGGSDGGLDAQADVVGAGDGGDAACPGMAGPAAIRVGSFCIDSTEVTNGQYADFLAQDGGAMPAVCTSFKTTHTPKVWPAPRVDTPVTYIDWCDAYAYCAWAGKRLCGKIDGGAATALTDTTDQWYSACTHAGDGAHAFAYGNAFQPGTCNTPESDAGGVLPVASLPQCVGGYAGLHDMIGNAYEWEDSCVGTAGLNDLCVWRSGSYIDPSGSSQTCASAGSSARGLVQPDIGFRCCSP